MTGLFRRHACDACGAKFSGPEQLMNHTQTVHGKNLLYDCKECEMHFASMEEMRTHLQRMHSYKKDR